MAGEADAHQIGVAMLGYGAIAELHAEALREAGARLLQVAGPNRSELDTFAARHGFKTAAVSPEAAIEADGVELVIVASPSPVHAQQARHALAAGRHVLAEIPLALSLQEGEELVALAAAKDLHLGVCHTLRFSEPFVRVQAAIAESGSQTRLVVARSLLRRLTNVGWTGRPRSWQDDLLWHHGGHVIDAVLTFLGSPVAEVAASAGPAYGSGLLPVDYAISLRTNAEAIASVALSYTALIPASDYLVIADAETYAITGGEAWTSRRILFRGDAGSVEKRALVAQDAAFVSALLGGARFASEAASILPTLRVQEAVARGRPFA